jgi:hypothetical protein
MGSSREALIAGYNPKSRAMLAETANGTKTVNGVTTKGK